MLKASSCSKLARKGEKNSFGLPAITSCPGRTPICEQVCYTHKLTCMYKDVQPVLDENLRHVNMRCDSRDYHTLRCELMGMVRYYPEFRIHWSGDFHRVDYAQVWRDVILCEMPNTRFWCYTRSFQFVPLFQGLPNLRLYLSLDKDNWDEGLMVWKDNPWTLISTMGMEDRHKDRITKWFNCPAIEGPLKGVDAACLKCRVCVDSRSPNIVNFPIHR